MIFRLALFAFLLIAAFVALYFLTRKTWDWNKYAKSLVLTLSSLLIIPLAIFAYVTYENRLQTLNEFAGISLGATTAEVKFSKGDPAHVTEHSTGNADEGKLYWRYTDTINKGNFLDISFDNGKVVEISYTGKCYYCETINDFGIGSYYQDIVKRFGEPSETIISEDELEHRLNYPQYHVFFILKEEKVIRHGIYL